MSGLNPELDALHSRRAQAENETREFIFAWAMEHCDSQTFAAIRSLNEAIRNIIWRAMSDTYNLPRPGDTKQQ